MRATRDSSPSGSRGSKRAGRERDDLKDPSSGREGGSSARAIVARSRLGAHHDHPAGAARASPSPSLTSGPPRPSCTTRNLEATPQQPSEATLVVAGAPLPYKANANSSLASKNKSVTTNRRVTWADHMGAALCSMSLPRIPGPVGRALSPRVLREPLRVPLLPGRGRRDTLGITALHIGFGKVVISGSPELPTGYW